MFRRLVAFLALIAFGALDAQAATRAYPSLGKRPIESLDKEAPAQESAPPVLPAPDPALVTETERLAGQGQAGNAAFERGLAEARRRVAAATGASPASEAWSRAQVEISALDAARYESVAALASMDTLYVEQLGKTGSAGAPMDGYRQTLATTVDRQNDLLDALKAALVQP